MLCIVIVVRRVAAGLRSTNFPKHRYKSFDNAASSPRVSIYRREIWLWTRNSLLASLSPSFESAKVKRHEREEDSKGYRYQVNEWTRGRERGRSLEVRGRGKRLESMDHSDARAALLPLPVPRRPAYTYIRSPNVPLSLCSLARCVLGDVTDIANCKNQLANTAPGAPTQRNDLFKRTNKTESGFFHPLGNAPSPMHLPFFVCYNARTLPFPNLPLNPFVRFM